MNNKEILEAIRSKAEGIIYLVDSLLESDYPIYKEDIENFENSATEIVSMTEDLEIKVEEED